MRCVEGLDALVDPAGLTGIRREQSEGVFPEFAGLKKAALKFESAGVFGELVEADAVNEGVALRAGEGLKRQV